jgi:hypothetical protein
LIDIGLVSGYHMKVGLTHAEQRQSRCGLPLSYGLFAAHFACHLLSASRVSESSRYESSSSSHRAERTLCCSRALTPTHSFRPYLPFHLQQHYTSEAEKCFLHFLRFFFTSSLHSFFSIRILVHDILIDSLTRDVHQSRIADGLLGELRAAVAKKPWQRTLTPRRNNRHHTSTTPFHAGISNHRAMMPLTHPHMRSRKQHRPRTHTRRGAHRTSSRS